MNQSWMILLQIKNMICSWTYPQLVSKGPQHSQKVDLDLELENAQIWHFCLFTAQIEGQLSAKSGEEGLYYLFVQQ